MTDQRVLFPFLGRAACLAGSRANDELLFPSMIADGVRVSMYYTQTTKKAKSRRPRKREKRIKKKENNNLAPTNHSYFVYKLYKI